MTLGTGSYCPTPLQIPGIQMWIDGNDPNGNGVLPGLGDSVPSWIDKTGFGNSFIQGTALNQPFFISNIVRNLSAIDFIENIPNFMTLGTSIFNFSGTSSFSLMFCMGPNTLAINQAIISKWNSGGTQQWMLSINSSNQFVFSRGADTVNSGVTTSTFDFQVITCTYDGAAMQLYVNGAQVGTTFTATSLSSNANAVTLGNEVGATMGLDGYIAEGFVGNIAFSTAQRHQLERYLGNRWGVLVN